jgi:hypothetical protein
MNQVLDLSLGNSMTRSAASAPMGTRLPGLGLPGLGRDPLDLDTDASAGPSSRIQRIASQAMLETALLPDFEAVAAER